LIQYPESSIQYPVSDMNILFTLIKAHKSFRKVMLKIRGKTEDDIHVKRIVSGKTWEDFCDRLKLAGAALMYSGAPRDAFQQAEGVRYLSRLTRAGLEAFVEYNDPAFPVFRRMVHETVKMGADNPDNHYYNAQISGEYEYRITGRRNTVHYIGFFTQNGNYGTTGGLAPCGILEHNDLILEEDGSFEFKGVPLGAYTVIAKPNPMREGEALLPKPVTVTAGKTVEIEFVTE